ncbi:protein misato homolog 1 [Spea bombifrons]|uniref:protein misato homolog 1 n=1 Tax=Spea bombifrons TaxID=233779 RepID=UPI0023498E23|nr:protein misato homolog 1 [Spea bombifrons]
MGEPCREVLTLQLGHYANFVGAHWWNLQDTVLSLPGEKVDHELCSDVLFRRGVTLKGLETYTPRLIALDLKGSLCSLREEGCLYEDLDATSSVPAWKGGLTRHQEEPPGEKPPLADLGHQSPRQERFARVPDAGDRGKRRGTEQNVSVWSDFLQLNLHPRSLCVVTEYNHEGETDGLESFGRGEALLRDSRYVAEIEDRLHFFTEECDYLQGFQILCDLHNGFSGVGARMVELLQDEYPGRGLLTWGTCPVDSGDTDLRKGLFRLMNTIMGIVQMAGHSSLFCPLTLNSNLGRRPGPPASFPHLLYDTRLQYHSSAVLALALDTVTAPYRLPSSHLSMAGLAENLNFCGRKVSSVSVSLPFPIGPDSCLPDALLPYMTSPPWTSLSACGNGGSSSGARCFSQSVVLRGVSKQRQISHGPAGVKQRSALQSLATGEEVLQHYVNSAFPGAVSAVNLLQQPARLGPSFPPFFSSSITKEGFTRSEPSREPPGVDSVPVLSALQTSTALHHTLRSLYEEIRRVDVRRCSSFFSAGVEEDAFQETLQELKSLSQCYSSTTGGDESDEEG